MPDVPQSARGLVDQFLANFGLQGLSNWAWGQYVALGGGQEAMAQIELELPNQPAFKDRFPAYDALAKKGRAMSPAEMLAYERTATQLMRAEGLPSGFYDQPSDFAEFLVNEVSVAELQQRVQLARNVVDAEPAERDALMRYGGLTEGELVAYTLDADRALPLVQRTYRAAQAGGAAAKVGISLDQSVAENLARENLSRQDLNAGFGQLQETQGLFELTAGEQGQEGFSQAEQVGSTFGTDPASRRRLKKKAEKRQSEFAGGSGYRATQGGVSGLGGT